MRDFFREIPTFLQDYVTRNHWSGFREVQQKSFAILFDPDLATRCNPLIV